MRDKHNFVSPKEGPGLHPYLGPPKTRNEIPATGFRHMRPLAKLVQEEAQQGAQ